MASSCQPTDPVLYEKVKKQIYKKYPVHSAYRSGLLVKEYKKQYKGDKPYKPDNCKKTLARWFKEDWKSDIGKYGYTSKSSVYRPTKRISKDTPTTFGELTKKDIEKAKKEKLRTGRVKKF